MTKFSWKIILAWLLAAFFIVGGIGNIFASATILADYQRWGYPSWFHYVTGTLELLSAALILRASTRLLGAGLAAAVMLGAAGTVVAYGEYTHSIAPLVVLAVTLIVLFNEWRRLN